jgi:hypothetical protein
MIAVFPVIASFVRTMPAVARRSGRLGMDDKAAWMAPISSPACPSSHADAVHHWLKKAPISACSDQPSPIPAVPSSLASRTGGSVLVPASSWVPGRTVQNAVELEGLDSDDTQGRFLDVAPT